MSGRHRLTKAGLKQDNDELRERLHWQQTETARLADALALCRRDRLADKEEAVRQHDVDSREIKRLQGAVRAWEAAWANAHRVDVPAPRDLRVADDQPTVPTDVSDLRAVYPITPQPAAPGATDPAHIPAA
ncbi:hypothetical protein [Streptomyces himalayensis]|uniref:Uncharacterized protein n=1 Tax=Streptomyces himalayensis subsp. himalayensis TaxID=2756131 RepID=A0A7W0DUP1_9ACTN|nr:hypothetical protein [Streptomyces himalayensis]MBA2951641.1 hypothetical protein [Streptomyces himalayensis subsp. himalayensis]